MPRKTRISSTVQVGDRTDPGIVLSWFGSQTAIPLIVPPRFREYGPIADDPDYPNAGFPSRFIEGVTFGIEYLDLRGWISTRVVRCIGLNASRPALLQAYCNVRKTTRTFRLDRIVATTNLSTGVTAQSGGQRVLFAPAFLPDDPICRTFVKLAEATRPGAFLLLFLAMRDGRLTPDAREVVQSYILEEARHRGLAVPPVDLLTMWLENLSPSSESVIDGVAKLLFDAEAVVRLLPRILEISRTMDRATRDGLPLQDLIKRLRLYFRPRTVAQAVDLGAFR